jgi:hypothetical protein
MRRNFLLAIGVFVSLSVLSRGQEKKEPPSRPVQVEKKEDPKTARDAKLPKIDLPEYVITGREVIELPSTSKLTPNDTANSLVDASQLSGLGEKSKASEPTGKSVGGLATPESFDGKLTLGYGNLNTRYGEGWFGKKFSEGDFSLHGRYLAHNAYVPFANASGGGVDAVGGIFLPSSLALFSNARLYGSAGYEGKQYRLFGSLNPSQERSVHIYRVNSGLSSSAGAVVSYDAAAQIRRLTIEDHDKSQEDELTLSLQLAHQTPDLHLKGSVFYGGSYLTQSFSASDPQYYKGSASVRKLFFEKLDLSGGVGLFHFRNSGGNFTSKVYPDIGLQYYLVQGLTLFARFDPSVERYSLGQAVAENRYLGNDVRIRHQDIFVNISGGVEFETLNRGSGRVYIKYQRVRDFPVYVDPSTTPLPDWDLFYAGITRFLSLNGEVLVNLTDADRVSGSARLLSSENSATKDRVPYLPLVQITSEYSHQFLFGLTTRVAGRFIGRRSIDFRDALHLNSFFLLGASAEYKVTRNFGVFVQLNNIFDERYSYWNLYQEVPFSAMGGITARW